MSNKLFVLVALVVLVGFAACDVPDQQVPPPEESFPPPTGEADTGAQQTFQCPDGTVVDDPALCPPPQ